MVGRWSTHSMELMLSPCRNCMVLLTQVQTNPHIVGPLRWGAPPEKCNLKQMNQYHQCAQHLLGQPLCQHRRLQHYHALANARAVWENTVFTAGVPLHYYSHNPVLNSHIQSTDSNRAWVRQGSHNAMQQQCHCFIIYMPFSIQFMPQHW